MAGGLTIDALQLGNSATAANNFVWRTNTDGTATLARGNVGVTTQDILTVNASGVITFTQGRQLTAGTAQATTSGTSIDFTSIPSWVKRVTVMLSGVSTSGTSNWLIQAGAGSVTTSGYLGQGSSGAGQSANSAGFQVNNNIVAVNTHQGKIEICLLGSNTYVQTGVVAAQVSTNSLCTSAGVIALSGALDRIRLTTVNGTDTFDAGSVNIMYEG